MKLFFSPGHPLIIVTVQPVIASEAKQSPNEIAAVATLPRNDKGVSERLLIILMLCLFLSLPSPIARAEGELPPSASAEILEKKSRDEGKKEILKEKPPAKVEIEEEETAPPAKDEVPFHVRTIRLKPSATMPTEALKSLISFEDLKPLIVPYLNRDLTFKDLWKLSKKLQNVYRSRGYFAVIAPPPQEIMDGEVILEVLISRMGDLSIEGNRYSRASKIRSYWKIPKGEILRYDRIAKSLQAMNEYPDRTIKSGLKAGTEPGTTDILLKVEDRFPLHGRYSFDNQGAKLTGKERQGFMLRHNNFLTLDDTFLIGTNFGHSYGALFLQHRLPLNTRGTELISGFSHAQVTPTRDGLEPFGINGISQTYSLDLRQKLYTSERVSAGAHIGFDFKEKRTRTLSVTTVWDRLRILTVGGEAQVRDKSGYWSFGQDMAFSMSPHGDGYALTSRQAESRFFKATFSIERQQKMPWGTKAVLRFQGQLSPHKLPPQEEIVMGGADTVRGYPESVYLGDQGIITNLEYWTPFFLVPKHWKFPRAGPIREHIQLFAFLDHGYARLREPSESEHLSRSLLGVGGGFAIHFTKHASARFEWGFPLRSDPVTATGNSQFHFRFGLEI